MNNLGMPKNVDANDPRKKKNSHTATKIKEKDSERDNEKMGLLILPTT